MPRKHKEQNIPGHLRVHVTYITQMRTDDPELRQMLPRWYTRAQLLDRETGRVVATGTAKCGPRDNPNRKVGRAIAVGRALKNYWQTVPVSGSIGFTVSFRD